MKSIILAAIALAAAPALAADYVVIQLHADTAVPADTAWAKIGAYCAIEQFAKVPCKLTSGAGGVGSVRTLANGVIEEPMVAQTAHSYTYGQTVGPNKDIDYHGTLAVEAAGPKQARIVYTIVYDAARMPSDAVRKAQFDRIGPRFQGAVEAMKKLAEAQP